MNPRELERLRRAEYLRILASAMASAILNSEEERLLELLAE